MDQSIPKIIYLIWKTEALVMIQDRMPSGVTYLFTDTLFCQQRWINLYGFHCFTYESVHFELYRTFVSIYFVVGFSLNLVS